jgi:HSP20 family protein
VAKKAKTSGTAKATPKSGKAAKPAAKDKVKADAKAKANAGAAAKRAPKAHKAPKTPPTPQTSPFEALRREVDQIFERVQSGDWRLPSFGEGADWRLPRWADWQVALPSNLVEKDGHFELSAELPGMTEADVELKIANGMLTIRGEKSEESEADGEGDVHIAERRFGSFQRSFRVPEGVDLEKIDAQMADGILTVTLPKTPAAQESAKKIQVRKKPG